MDNAKKKRIKRYISWGCLAALVLGLAVMPLMAQSEVEEEGPVASILSATAQTGSVGTALHGGGTLASDGAEDVIIPTGVKITEFLVSNGDAVTAGTPLAAVDKVSVMTAITAVTETMEYLQDEIESAKDDTISNTIYATAGGRVKKIFAKAGESVQEVMLRDGALAVLSLDGMMAVKIERSVDIRTGEAVTVTLSDGTEITGRVESNLDGVVVITVEDEGYAIGEQVTVTGGGERIGAGRLYIHNAWKATAFSGTISTVNAREESTVSSGSSLFTLTDTDYAGEMEHRANQHREYEELLQDLFRMYESGTIDAPCDGVISGVDKDSAHLLSGEGGQWQITLLNDTHTRQASFAAFAAQVTEVTETGLSLRIDPSLRNLDSLYNLSETVVDTAAMTEARTYSGDAGIYTQSADGSLTTGTVKIGDSVLFIGDESGIIWIVNLDASVPTVDYRESGVQLTLLADGEVQPLEDQLTCRPGTDCPLDADSQLHQETCVKACDRASGCNAVVHYENCISQCDHADLGESCEGTTVHDSDCIEGCINSKTDGACESGKHYLTCIGSCASSNGTEDCPATRIHKTDCIEACSHADISGGCDATKYHYTDCIESCTSSTGATVPCPSSKHKDNCYFAGMVYQATAAKVEAVGTTALVVSWDASGTVYTVEKSSSGWVLANGATLNESLLVYGDGPTVPISNPGGYSKGDVILIVTGYKGEEAVWSDVVVYKKNAGSSTGGFPSGGFGSMSGMSGLASMIGGFSGYGNYSGTVTQDTGEDLYDLEGSVLMTVTPQDTMTLTITLDEKDISRVALGQTARIKVEALRGQTFEGVVSKIAISGTNNGGSSKFTVELTLNVAENMLEGMSATASIPLDTRDNVLTIPLAALAEDGARTVVYTALDEKTGEPSNPVEVETGLSDGENVEILSGLSDGDTVYYSYYDTLELSTEVEAGFSFGR